MWSVSSILAGLLSFMLENTKTAGSVETTDDEKKIYARNSLEYNKKDHNFKELFLEDMNDFLSKKSSTSHTVGSSSSTAGNSP